MQEVRGSNPLSSTPTNTAGQALCRPQPQTASEFAELLAGVLGWRVTPEAVESWETATVPPGDVLVASGLVAHRETPPAGETATQDDLIGRLIGSRFADVTAIFATRSEFTSNLPPHLLFDDARSVRAAGLSLNLICQQYADQRFRKLLADGAIFQCLFLDPAGDAIKQREQEEGFPAGYLSALTDLNIRTIQQRVRDRLPAETRDRLQLAAYDETIRLNLILIDQQTCIMQPYLPEARGVDSPTFLIHRRWPTAGLFPACDQVFNSLWERSTPL
jgi:hypothetical protein